MAADPQTQPPPTISDAEAFTPPSVSHLQNVAYLIGHPIAHSSSPALHDTISATSHFPYAQVLAESKDLVSFLHYLRHHPSSPRLLGSGVTMPHKVAVIPHLDDLTPEARAVGAVNTIFFHPSSDPARVHFTGHNTDTIGIRDAFLSNVHAETISRCRGRPGLIVGGGGTCRAAIYALQQFLGCSALYIVNRDAGEVEAVLGECRKRGAADDLVHVSSVAQAEALEAPRLIVSAVPDFAPQTDGERAVRDILGSFLRRQPRDEEERGALLEMCYHPSPDTQISRLAAEAGWQVIGGLEAMIGQGLEQAKLWTGVPVTESLRDAARVAVRPKH